MEIIFKKVDHTPVSILMTASETSTLQDCSDFMRI